MSLTHAIKWSFLAEVASKAITPLIFVVLARLLTPEDYGVVAAATMVISFSQVFWEAGMSKAIIQYQGERDAAANSAFWVNNLLGVAVASLLVATSSLIAESVFQDSRVTAVLQVMSIQVVLGAVTSVPTALLQKDMRFKRLFLVRVLTVSAPGLLSIPLAWHGMGYWALVAGMLIGQAVQVVVLWRASAWRPAFVFDFAVASRLAKFGAWVAASGLLSWFYLWADSLVVGVFLGSHDLGLYRTGNTLVIMVYAVLLGPMLPVLYSHFSQNQGNRDLVRDVLQRATRFISFVAIPIAFLLYAFAQPIGWFVFGERWQGIEVVIAIMALAHGLSCTVGANGEAYRAIGRPDYETKIMALSLLMYGCAYWLSVQQGFETFLWTRLILVPVALLIHFWVAHSALEFPVARTFGYIAKVSAVGIPLVFIGHNLALFGDALPQQLVVAIPTAAVLTISYLWLIERNALIPETIGRFTRRARATVEDR